MVFTVISGAIALLNAVVNVTDFGEDSSIIYPLFAVSSTCSSAYSTGVYAFNFTVVKVTNCAHNLTTIYDIPLCVVVGSFTLLIPLPYLSTKDT